MAILDPEPTTSNAGSGDSMGAPSSDAPPPDEAALKPEEDVDAAYELDELADSKPKKRRKVVKESDKKYHCPHSDCTRSYSRAEHLYRHQLNHTPKQIYRCDFPGCDRHFVRADLCARHRERHTAKGSHLQRKDAFLNSQRTSTGVSRAPSPTGTATINSVSPVLASHGVQLPLYSDISVPVAGPVQAYSTMNDRFSSGVTSKLMPLQVQDGLPLAPPLASTRPYSAFPGGGNVGLHLSPVVPPPSPSAARRFSFDGSFVRPGSQAPPFHLQHPMTLSSMQPPPISSPPTTGPFYAQQPYPSPAASAQTFRSPSAFTTLPQLPPFGFPQGYGAPARARSGSIMSPPAMSSAEMHPMPNSRTNSVADFNVIDQMTAGYAMPVFGNMGFNRSPPSVMDDNFISSLFESSGLDGMQPSPPGPEPMIHTQIFNMPLPKLDPNNASTELSLPAGDWSSTPTTNGLDINMRESSISERKKLRLAELVSGWREIEHNPGRRSKADLLMGDSSDPHHVLSLHMLKTYITSYWMHIHQQMPIFHRPTFNPETCPDLLLLTMMCLGATCLERTHAFEVTQDSAELGFFMAYHIRWEVFKDAEFRPTAKLWTFQTMLLLELFEKMFSTRTLHERAHIHHATTLTVMRRGSSLIGRSATTDLPSGDDDPTRTPPGPDGSINTSGQNTPDAYWNRWITAEATRRIAFAAFVIDSTHATLFGHTAVMSPHELRLPLPCDEALWSATSSAEVHTVEASLAANGFKPTTFVDGLKRTLNGQKVRTNTFGRVILMAGLLNISWHLTQRDLQVSSLGAANMLGNQIKWKSPLTRAFDFWRRDFDESLSKNEHWLQVCTAQVSDRTCADYRGTVFESRTCLHSLAHMAMHVDIIDCQVFAGAERVLGRIVTPADRAAVQRRMREHWAPTARARDAVFYALRFLCEVLIPESELSTKRPHPHQPPTFTYSARTDYLLNRPWVLYFALLIVWGYGYALDGPLRPSNYTLSTRELQIFDMQRYLIRMGGVASPDDLALLKDRNSCLGLLLLLRESFRQPRWELLHDANEVLASCIDMLLPGQGGGVGEAGTGVGGDAGGAGKQSHSV